MCLFVFMLYITVNNFSVFIGWTITKQKESVLLKDTMQHLGWVSNLWPFDLKSTMSNHPLLISMCANTQNVLYIQIVNTSKLI